MSDAVVVTPAVLRDLAPVRPEGSAHKGMRGSVLIIGGSSEMPGAVLLAGIAALRAGAGVLQIATVESTAVHLATAIPEARVIGLPETAGGEIARSSVTRLVDLATAADAVLLGPGMTDDDELAELVPALLRGATEVAMVVDARALGAVTPQALAVRDGQAVLTPNVKEACTMIEADIDEVAGKAARLSAHPNQRFRLRSVAARPSPPRQVSRSTATKVAARAWERQGRAMSSRDS